VILDRFQQLVTQAQARFERLWSPTTEHRLEIIGTDLVYRPTTAGHSVFDSYYFHLREHDNGHIQELHKVVKLLALDFVPLEAREQLTILEKMRMALRGLYNAQVDFVYLVAGMFQPVHLGITQCYGVIGYDPVAREAAEAKAAQALASLQAVLANFEQSRLKPLSLTEVEWLRRAFAEMQFGLVGLGHPDPSRTARAIAQAQTRRPLDEFTLEQNELLYRGMALLGEEFVNVVMAYRVAREEIIDLQVRTAREASLWASKEKGTRGINVGLGVPLMLSGAFGQLAGTSYGQGQNMGVADVDGHAVSHGQGVGVAHTVTHGEAHTDGVADTTSVTTIHSVGHSVGAADGKSHTDSNAHTDSTAHTDSVAHTDSHATTVTDGSSHTEGSSWSHTDSQSQTTPQGLNLPIVGDLGGILSGVSGGSVKVGAGGMGGIPGDTLNGNLNGGATLNFSTGTSTNGSVDTSGGFSSGSAAFRPTPHHIPYRTWPGARIPSVMQIPLGMRIPPGTRTACRTRTAGPTAQATALRSGAATRSRTRTPCRRVKVIQFP